MFKKFATLLLASTIFTNSALSMTFSREQIDNENNVVIIAKGDIDPGDDAKLHRFVNSFAKTDHIQAIILISKGGIVSESLKLANTIHSSKIYTFVPSDVICASACFLLFAAGTQKMVGEGAKIGIHSAANVNGKETASAQSATIMMARIFTDLGVPPSIIGKMVTTEPDNITWLTDDDLKSMNVEIVSREQYQQETQTEEQSSGPLIPGGIEEPIRQPPTPAQSGPRPTQLTPGSYVAPIQSQPVQNQAYNKGVKDRQAYEDWFSSLSGEEQSGAAWWAENRSRKLHGENVYCDVRNGTLWYKGCTEAIGWLTLADNNRLANPDYRAGWNSIP